MLKWSTIILLLLQLQFAFSSEIAREKFTAMGSSFGITLIDSSLNQQQLQALIIEGVKSVESTEALISSWKSSSQTSAINRAAGVEPVKVDAELFNLIQRSKRVSEITNGLFDISFQSIDKIWEFNRDYETLPDSQIVAAAVSKINFENIILDATNQTVFLKEKGMKIGFGAIGKGYMAEQLKRLYQSRGIDAGLIDCGGDITTWGKYINDRDWNIEIYNPKWLENKSSFNTYIENKSIVTSGNYERFISINGVKYSHIIHPKTGWPIVNLSSITVICDNAELADALATALFVMGIVEGLQFVNRLNGIEAIFIDEQGKYILSEGLK